jgi:PPOX class probable F420-dependent enzyme
LVRRRFARSGAAGYGLAGVEAERYINLETFKRDGTGVKTPVWFATLNGKLYVFTDGTSYKVKRLRRDARIRVAPCSVSGRIAGPWREGHGRIVTDERLEERTYAALAAKYGWQMTAVNLASRLAGRIGRRAILELEV